MNKLKPGVAGKQMQSAKDREGEGAGMVGQFHQLKKRGDGTVQTNGCNVGVEFQQERGKEALRWREQDTEGGKRGQCLIQEGVVDTKINAVLKKKATVSLKFLPGEAFI